MSGPRPPATTVCDVDWLAQITAEAAPPLTADTIDRLRLVLAPKTTTRTAGKTRTDLGRAA